MDDPYPVYDRLRREAPIHWSPEENGWILSRYADVAAVMAAKDFLVVELAETVAELNRAAGREIADLRSVLEAVLFLRNPPAHDDARRFLVAVMTSRSLSTYVPVIQDVSRSLLSPLHVGDSFDAVKDYADLVPPLFMARLLGIPDMDVRSLMAIVCEVTMTFDRGRSLRFYARVDRTVAEARSYFLQEIGKRRRAPRDDGLSRMIALSDERFKLDDDELASRALFLLIAGVETTSALIGNAIRAVVEHSDVARELRRRPDGIERVTEEVMRYDGPVHQATRIAVKDGEIGGCAISAGDRVVLLVAGAHHDPAEFERPWAFDPSRSRLAHLGFGKGLHSCIGASLAKLETQIALVDLLKRDPEPLSTEARDYWPHRTLRRLKSYPVRFSA